MSGEGVRSERCDGIHMSIMDLMNVVVKNRDLEKGGTRDFPLENLISCHRSHNL